MYQTSVLLNYYWTELLSNEIRCLYFNTLEVSNYMKNEPIRLLMFMVNNGHSIDH